MNGFQNNNTNDQGYSYMNNNLTNNQANNGQVMMNDMQVNNINYNNQPPMNNQYNGYNNTASINGSNKKNNKVFIIIGVVLLIIIVIIAIGILLSKLVGSNTDYTCTKSSTEGNIKMNITLKGTFNSKNDSGTSYKLIENNKLVIEDTDGLTDSKYEKYVTGIFSDCSYDKDCTGNHVKLGLTSLGFDTVIDRSGNKITITYKTYIGAGYNASKSYKKSVINDYIKDDYTCK